MAVLNGVHVCVYIYGQKLVFEIIPVVPALHMHASAKIIAILMNIWQWLFETEKTAYSAVTFSIP